MADLTLASENLVKVQIWLVFTRRQNLHQFVGIALSRENLTFVIPQWSMYVHFSNWFGCQ
jgi:hypothetical protein